MPAKDSNGWAIEYARQTNAHLAALSSELHAFRASHDSDMRDIRELVSGCVSNERCDERRIEYGKRFVSQRQAGKIGAFFTAIGGAGVYILDLLKVGDRVRDVLPK